MSTNDRPQQLSLLPTSDLPVQFRLDAETRRRGLQHVAEIRHLLAERQRIRAEQAADDRRSLPRPIRPTAA